MGFNSFMTHVLLAANKEKNFDTSVPFGLAGRQSVFMDAARIENIAISYGNHSDSQKSILAEGTTDHETLRTRGHVTDRDFMKALFDVQTLSFDATDYEKTSTILDLNVPFNRQADGGKLLGTLDGLYDGGCLDNV